MGCPRSAARVHTGVVSAQDVDPAGPAAPLPGRAPHAVDSTPRLSLPPALQTWLRDRSGQAVALALLDVVDLRGVNSAEGHDVGDRVLSDVAVRLRLAQPEGPVVRWQGDMFIVGRPAGDVGSRVRLGDVCREATVGLETPGGRRVLVSVGSSAGLSAELVLAAADRERHRHRNTLMAGA